MHLTELPNGYAELRDDGTWSLHPFKFHQAGDDIIRTDFDNTGNIIKKYFYEPHVLVIVDAKSGLIKHVQKGFVLDHEVLGAPKAQPGELNVQIRQSEVSGLYSEIDRRVIIKCFDSKTNTFISRPEIDIEQEIAQFKAIDTLRNLKSTS